MTDYQDKLRLFQDIQNCGFFASLPDVKIQHFIPFFERTSVNPGAILFYQGEPSDFFYVLINGRLESYLVKSSGETEILGIINPGESVGELGGLSGEPRSLTVEAVVKSELLRLPSNKFREICIEYPSVLAEISKFIIHRSLQTIRFIAKEKKLLDLSVILPLFQEEKSDWILKVKKYLQRFSNVIIENDLVQNLNNKIKQYDAAALQDKKLFFFLEKWDDDFFKHYKNKLSLYLVFNEAEKKLPYTLIEKIDDIVKKLPEVRLELILLHDAHATIANTKKWLDLAKFDLHHHVRRQNESDYRRLTRFMTGNAFTLVLGGGGGKGLAHLGVIKAILDKQIRIDAIGGASIGAGIAACYAYTLKYAQTRMFVERLKKASVQSLSLSHLTWPIISLFSADPGTQMTIDLFRNVAIEDLLIPFFAVSSNLSEKIEHVHCEGLIWEAIRSSTAIPGVFPPIALDGDLHYDGGLLNNLPVDVMRRRVGTDNKVIAVTLTKTRGKPDNYRFPPVVRIRDVAFSRFRKTKYIYPSFFQTFLEALLLGSYAKEVSNAKDADILIRPKLTGFKTLSIAAKREEEMIQKGYDDATIALEKYLIGQPDYSK